MKNKKTVKLLKNEYFNKLYINYKQDIYGNDLEDGKIALRARKVVDEELQWREIEIDSDKPEIVNHYIDVLKNDFE